MVERFRRYCSDKIEHMDRMTDGQMYRRTDVQTDRVILNLCGIRLRCQAIQNTYAFYAYVTNNVKILLRIHYGKNAVSDENLNECGKELW